MKAAEFWDNVEKRDDGCWWWLRACSNGYGRVWFGGRQRVSHQVAYELAIGPIPEGKVLDHLCRNPSCVNPEHLEPVRQRTNLARGRTFVAENLAKTECVWGHPFDTENTYTDKLGKRHCKACRRRRLREYAAKKRAVA